MLLDGSVLLRTHATGDIKCKLHSSLFAASSVLDWLKDLRPALQSCAHDHKKRTTTELLLQYFITCVL